MVRCWCWKNPTKYLWRWEIDRRSTFFFMPPAHLCAVTNITEIYFNVTLSYQSTNLPTNQSTMIPTLRLADRTKIKVMSYSHSSLINESYALGSCQVHNMVGTLIDPYLSMVQEAERMSRVTNLWGAVLLFIQHFLISRYRFLDIKKWISLYQEMNFSISRNEFLNIKKWILDIKKYFWYQEILFYINNSISWYQEIEFLISRIPFLDIKNFISWYQEFHFLISGIRFLDIKK